jgi:hypothetical protein
MYKIFINEDFPKEDEDLVFYWNIKKRGFYAIVTRTNIFPYNYVVRWIYSHLEQNLVSIISDAGTMGMQLQEIFL